MSQHERTPLVGGGSINGSSGGSSFLATINDAEYVDDDIFDVEGGGQAVENTNSKNELGVSQLGCNKAGL